jgi:hypothetical protein
VIIAEISVKEKYSPCVLIVNVLHTKLQTDANLVFAEIDWKAALIK